MGTEVVAQCKDSVCSSITVANDAACAGMKGPDCGAFGDIICMPGRGNKCKTSCSNMTDCDADAFCDAGRCVLKRGSGEMCNSGDACMSGNCLNDTCCPSGGECCRTADQCTKNSEPRCDQSGDTKVCQGSRKMATCMNSLCMYSADRIDDDSACKTGGSKCGFYRDVDCNGSVVQPMCSVTCSGDSDCDPGSVCVISGTAQKCLPLVTTAGTGGGGGGGGASGSSNPR